MIDNAGVTKFHAQFKRPAVYVV